MYFIINKNIFTVVLFTLVIYSCSQNPTSDNTENNYQYDVSNPTEDSKESYQEEVSVDGTYTGSVSGAGAGGEFTVKIYGSKWFSKLRINAYDQGTSESGLVKGNDLYDESGFSKVGYISGKTLTMGRFSATK